MSCELSNTKFYRNAALVCDVMTKQNELNILLQGRNKSIYDMWQKPLSLLVESNE